MVTVNQETIELCKFLLVYSIRFFFSEGFIAMAVLRLVEEEKCVVEGAGATGLAAAIAGHLDYLKGKRYVEETRAHITG